MAAYTKVDLKNAARFINGIKVQGAAIRGIRAACLRGVNEILTFIIPSRSPEPRDRGLYRSGWRSVQTVDGATVQNDEPHAVFIEKGVRNVRVLGVAQKALQEWVVRKGLATPEEAASVAYAVGVAMKRRGHIFGQIGMGVLNELVVTKMPTYIREEVAREFRRELGGK